MDKFPKPYSFDWWLSLYDRVNKIRCIFFARCRNGDEDAIKEYTKYDELYKWIRQRLKESHYNEISDAVWEYH